MNYNDVKSPEELLEFMDIINYGFVDTEGKKYGSFDEEAFEKNVLTRWHLSSVDRLIEVGYGHCFDQVELERDWFSNNGFSFKTYYIMFLLDYPNEYSTHTFLIYEQNNKWLVFEHSDYFERGILEFNSLEEALRYKMNCHIVSNRKYNKVGSDEIRHLRVYEYGKPRIDSTFKEFIDNILDNGRDVTPNIFD